MRKFALLATAVIAALALTATAASATPIQVRNASTGQLCPAVSPAINAGNANAFSTSAIYASGGCTVQMWTYASETIQYGGLAGMDARCYTTYDLHVGPDGYGWANNFVYQSGGSCSPTMTECAGSRTIAPPDFDSANFPGDEFGYSNASTELNVARCAYATGWGQRWGAVSLDMAPDGVNYLRWTNQQTTGASALQRFYQGVYRSPASITITHL
jgi:hypothetical protein